jgi:prophage DNA circulation protein
MNAVLNEGVSVTNAILGALALAAPGSATSLSADLTFRCSQLQIGAAAMFTAAPWNNIGASAFWPACQACFDAALAAGATYETMDIVRVLITTLNPKTALGAQISNFCMRQALAEQAQILAAMTFTSRNQVDAYIAEVETNFGAAIEVAADNFDNVVYQALIALQAAVTACLNGIAFPLPSITTVTFPSPLNALFLAQTLFQDPTQVAEIVAMNGISNPIFCPTQLTVLSEA